VQSSQPGPGQTARGPPSAAAHDPGTPAVPCTGSRAPAAAWQHSRPTPTFAEQGARGPPGRGSS